MNNFACFFGILTCSLNIYLMAVNKLYGTSMVFMLLAMMFGLELIQNVHRLPNLIPNTRENKDNSHKKENVNGTK